MPPTWFSKGKRKLRRFHLISACNPDEEGGTVHSEISLQFFSRWHQSSITFNPCDLVSTDVYVSLVLHGLTDLEG